MTHVHLIGIGGSGLSAIALVLLESGVEVTGSDRMLSPLAQRVREAGGRVYVGHRTENVSGADLVVRSSAIADDNVEVQAALAAGIPVLKRAETIGRLMAGRKGIAVAGTHGKTTTTAMIAWTLTALGQDPSYIIGGISGNLGSNAHAGHGPHFVIEADEYDHMFLGLEPYIAVVTNVEHDHPDCYPTRQDYHLAFLEFAGRVVREGALLACREDPGSARLLAEASARGQRTLSYGIEDPNSDYQATDLTLNSAGGYTFRVTGGLKPETLNLQPVEVSLQVPGRHNVLNALAALATASQLGLWLPQAALALGQFAGTARRFEILGEASGVTVVDDYAHNPTKIRATLAAARARFPGRPIWAVWQPHTYSRTRALFDDFAAAFDDADHVLVTEIYPARETPPADGFSARQVVAAMSHPEAYFVPELPQVRDALLAYLRPGDVVLVLSAGDADQVGAEVLRVLQRQNGTGKRTENSVDH